MASLLLILTLVTTAFALPTLNKNGEKIRVQRALVEDKVNVLFFHAPWSKTSSRFKVELEKWQKANPDTVIHQVNVKNLKSPVSKQYKLKSVPAFQVYDEEGTLKMTGQDAHNEVVKMLSR